MRRVSSPASSRAAFDSDGLRAGVNVVVTGASGMLGAHIVEVRHPFSYDVYRICTRPSQLLPHPSSSLFFNHAQLLVSSRCIGPFPVVSIVAFDLKPFARLNSLDWEAAAASEANQILQQAGASAAAFTPAAAAAAASIARPPTITSVTGDIRNRRDPIARLFGHHVVIRVFFQR